MRTLIPFLALSASHASTIAGNPDSEVILDSGPDVYVHSVVAYSCTSGSQTLPVDATLAETESEPLSFDEDEYCDVVVRVKWTPTGPLTPVSVTGYDSLEISESAGSFAIVIDSTAKTAVFEP